MQHVKTLLFSLAIMACNDSPKDKADVDQQRGQAGTSSNSARAGSTNQANYPSAGAMALANSGSSASGASPNINPSSSQTGGATGITTAQETANAGRSAGGATSKGGGSQSGGSGTTGVTGIQGGTKGSNVGSVVGGVSSKAGASNKGGTSNLGGAGTKAGATGLGGLASGGLSGKGGVGGATRGGTGAVSGATSSASGGASSNAGASGAWSNIRVVGNHLSDRWGKPFAVRGIESMFGNGSSNATAFVAGHKALGANTLSPLPNTSASSINSVQGLLAAAYAAGLVIGLNADHTNQGEDFFRNTQLRTIVNRYPNVFLAEAVELGNDMTENEWVSAAKAKVDAYVELYPDKPLKIGSPMGGRSPRFALDRCQDVVDYYHSKGGRGGLIFTCQLYWKASNANWSYQEENGFSDGLPGILQAIDAMAASPCLFMPGLDNQDDVGYTGWREIMDHVRAGNADPNMRLSYQWWVYYNSGDPYDNDLTTNANDALAGITAIGRDVKEKLELDRQYIELGPLNP